MSSLYHIYIYFFHIFPVIFLFPHHCGSTLSTNHRDLYIIEKPEVINQKTYIFWAPNLQNCLHLYSLLRSILALTYFLELTSSCSWKLFEVLFKDFETPIRFFLFRPLNHYHYKPFSSILKCVSVIPTNNNKNFLIPHSSPCSYFWLLTALQNHTSQRVDNIHSLPKLNSIMQHTPISLAQTQRNCYANFASAHHVDIACSCLRLV